jgi:hypothetical protein
MLPSGPKWKCKPWVPPHPTKKPVRLYYRDPIECLECLFNNPLLADVIKLVPFRQFKTAEKLVRVFSEWMSGNVAWEMQASLHFCHLIDPINADFIRMHSLMAQHYLALFYHRIRPPSRP